MLEGEVVEKVVGAFGGLSPMARALGHKHVTTVDGWRKAKRIPPWRRSEILEAAEKAQIELPREFLDCAA